MTKRLQTCSTCSGKTRHTDRRCSRCRNRDVVYLVREIADPMRPTVAELARGVPVGHMVREVNFRGRGA